jgi:hypothetical protein
MQKKNDSYRDREENYQQRRVVMILWKIGGIRWRNLQIIRGTSEYEPRSAEKYMEKLAIRWEKAFILYLVVTLRIPVRMKPMFGSDAI